MPFVKIFAFADPVHHREQSGRMQWRQNTVPRASIKIHALMRGGLRGSALKILMPARPPSAKASTARS